MEKIFFIGGGAIATALGNVLAAKDDVEVTLVTIENEVTESITHRHVNQKYFPSIRLDKRLKAVNDFSILAEKAFVFIAIPSVVAVDIVLKHRIHPESVIINLAKGFGEHHQTIAESLSAKLPNPVCTLKGPSFAREIINGQHTAFTLGVFDSGLIGEINGLFSHTTIHLDATTDVKGVEILSILKNIYAIVVGIVDAQFESPNMKFFIFTRAFNELRRLLILFGGKEETIFNYCGIGDFALTSLNDLSRNRTLGLLIGKGFFTDYISKKVVLEGKIAVNVFYELMVDRKIDTSTFPVMGELYKVFNDDYDVSQFIGRILNSD